MMESTASLKLRLVIRRAPERRKTTYLKGPPFWNQNTWVLTERRRGDRRRGPHGGTPRPPLRLQPMNFGRLDPRLSGLACDEAD